MDRWGEPKLAVSSVGLVAGQCCVLLGRTGSSLVSGVHSERTDALKTVYQNKKPQTISSLTELNSFRSHWCWECCTPSEVRGDYECSASQQRCSVPRRLICRLIYPERALGELRGQQNTICRARSLIKRRSGTRLLPTTATSGAGG